MTRHIHAELMMQYAQDALETDKPWERWELWGELSKRWLSINAGSSPAWFPDSQYRRKTTPYEPTLLDQALELEIEAARLRANHFGDTIGGQFSAYANRFANLKSLRSPAMIEHLKQQGKL